MFPSLMFGRVLNTTLYIPNATCTSSTLDEDKKCEKWRKYLVLSSIYICKIYNEHMNLQFSYMWQDSFCIYWNLKGQCLEFNIYPLGGHFPQSSVFSASASTSFVSSFKNFCLDVLHSEYRKKVHVSLTSRG